MMTFGVTTHFQGHENKTKEHMFNLLEAIDQCAYNLSTRFRGPPETRFPSTKYARIRSGVYHGRTCNIHELLSTLCLL